MTNAGIILGYLFPCVLERLRRRMDLQARARRARFRIIMLTEQDVDGVDDAAEVADSGTETYCIIDCLGDRCDGWMDGWMDGII